MASTISILTLVAASLLAVLPVSAATVHVTPPGTIACIWDVRAPDARQCVTAVAGSVTLRLPEGTGDTLVTFSAPTHFDLVIAATQLASTPEIRLDPLPLVRWRGWRGADPETTIEWFPSDEKSNAWQRLKTVQGPHDETLPGAALAVRLSPRIEGMSPRTLFPERPRASLTIPAIDLQPGGELAVCLTKRGDLAGERVRATSDDGKAPKEGVTGKNGCLSFPGLTPGRYEVRSARDAFESRRAIVRAGQSTWLGSIPIPAPAELEVSVADADLRHRYEVSLRVVGSTPQRPGLRPVKHVVARETTKWTVRPNEYEVIARPEAYPGIELRRLVSVTEGAHVSVVFEPGFVTVWGVAKEGRVAAANLTLAFRSADDRGQSYSVAAHTGADGAYEAVLPAPGKWTVSAAAEGQRNWSAPEIQSDVPLASRYEWNIPLPVGHIAGRVTDRETGAPIAQLTVEARWQGDDKASRYVSAQTGADGVFKLSGLPSTDITVEPSTAMVRMLGYAPEPSRHLTPDADTPPLLFALGRARAGVTLHVTDSSGNSLSGAQAFLASPDPLPPLLGRADSEGRIVLSDDLPLPVNLYVIASGSPWKRVAVPEQHDEVIEIPLPSPHVVISEFAFPDLIAIDAETPWGLQDELGYQVPVFFHLLRQGIAPAIRNRRASLPLAAPGIYRLWIKVGGYLRTLQTVALPSPEPIVVTARQDMVPAQLIVMLDIGCVGRGPPYSGHHLDAAPFLPNNSCYQKVALLRIDALIRPDVLSGIPEY